jgi:hypothetical protein
LKSIGERRRDSTVGVYQRTLPPAVPSNLPYARGGRLFRPPAVTIFLIGPRGRETVEAVLDSGGECCLFPEWLAWRAGYRQSPTSPVLTVGSSVSQTGVSAWFETVELELVDPSGVQPPFRWKSAVGFTPRGSFSRLRTFGILGVNGGLDRFRRVEFDWSALGGPEVVLRA